MSAEIRELHGMDEAFKLVESFKRLYHRLNADTCSYELITSVYHDDMAFQDSFHQIDGADAFVQYCQSLYENLKQCGFEFHDHWVTEEDAMLVWTMSYRHPRINRGRTVSVEGASLIRFCSDDSGVKKVCFHRDYFDGGELLYEHIPLMGSLIRTLKKRMN